MLHTAYCPCPPHCFTCRPCPAAGRTNVSRNGTRTSTSSTPTPYRFESRSSNTSAWASPIVHSTIWWVSALCSTRSVGSSAASRCEPRAELVLVGSWRGPGSPSAAGDRASVHGFSTSGVSTGAQGVAGLGSAEPSDGAEVARDRRRSRALDLAERHREGSDPLVLVVVLVARAVLTPLAQAERCPDTWTVASGSQGSGEHPDQADPPDIRIGGRLDDLRDERTGRVAHQPRTRAARGCVDGRHGCSSGDGKADTMRSSSSVAPTPLVESTGTTGWNDPRDDRELEVSTRRSGSMSSPPT